MMQDYKMEMIKEVVIRWVFCFGISIIFELAVSPHIEMGFALGFTSFLYFITKFKFYAILGPFLVICVPIGLALENCGLSTNLLLYFFGIMPVLEIGWYLISY
ncbi:hypothetical protein [uncultured Holdemanella sp.]|uniref:hypothetical protein n=1 Tax=uncultured Holdemanella sp. TaxID=1763549 RepID=UPI0025ED7477|nr:hypothetical protein [uncultured Holdemanella sp.]